MLGSEIWSQNSRSSALSMLPPEMPRRLASVSNSSPANATSFLFFFFFFFFFFAGGDLFHTDALAEHGAGEEIILGVSVEEPGGAGPSFGGVCLADELETLERLRGGGRHGPVEAARAAPARRRHGLGEPRGLLRRGTTPRRHGSLVLAPAGLHDLPHSGVVSAHPARHVRPPVLARPQEVSQRREARTLPPRNRS